MKSKFVTSRPHAARIVYGFLLGALLPTFSPVYASLFREKGICIGTVMGEGVNIIGHFGLEHWEDNKKSDGMYYQWYMNCSFGKKSDESWCTVERISFMKLGEFFTTNEVTHTTFDGSLELGKVDLAKGVLNFDLKHLDGTKTQVQMKTFQKHRAIYLQDLKAVTVTRGVFVDNLATIEFRIPEYSYGLNIPVEMTGYLTAEDREFNEMLNGLSIADRQIYEKTFENIDQVFRSMGNDSFAVEIFGRERVGEIKKGSKLTRREVTKIYDVSFREFETNLKNGGMSEDGMQKAVPFFRRGMDYLVDKEFAGHDTESADVDVEKNIALVNTQKQSVVAVIIGNQKYNKIWDAKYSIRDADWMKEYFVRRMGVSPDNVISESNITLSEMNALLGVQSGDAKGSRLYRRLAGAKDWDVIVYFSGHGATNADDKQSYLLPVDADPDYLTGTAYRLDALYHNLRQLTDGKITVILESCFSGRTPKGQIGGKTSGVVIVDPKALAPKGIEILAAAKADQVANWYVDQNHGLFTYYLMRALRGEADTNGDSKVVGAELKDYVTREVSRLSDHVGAAYQEPDIHINAETVWTE